MAQNVSFHRTSKRQDIIKKWLVAEGKITQTDMDAYKGVSLGDDESVILLRLPSDDEKAKIAETVKDGRDTVVQDVYALFNGVVSKVQTVGVTVVKTLL